MDVICDFAECAPKHGGHGHTVCSAVQSASLWRLFRARMEEVEEGARHSKVFEMEQTLLLYIQEQGNYQKNYD